MKESTKETVEWIKDMLKAHRLSFVTRTNGVARIEPSYLKDEADAIRLLDKLLELENALTRGGIIRDSNGHLCKDGDRIRAENNDGEEWEGTLSWDIFSRQFCFDWDNISEPLGERQFEKIYEE